jgi:uncharacterized membrane protein YdbT with pleckstrin-like domain
VLATPEERVCLEARRHGIVLARPLGRALVVAAGGLFLFLLGWPASILGAPVLVLAAVFGVRAVWRWEHTRMVVTTEKVYVVGGTARRRANAVRLRSIRSLGLEESLAGRMLGYGTVLAGPLELDYVPHPREVYRLVERLCA